MNATHDNGCVEHLVLGQHPNAQLVLFHDIYPMPLPINVMRSPMTITTYNCLSASVNGVGMFWYQGLRDIINYVPNMTII